jgi:hypothetical protein
VSEGSCRCGEVRFRAEGAPLVTMACHCTGCQRMTASAFSLSSVYPADRFEVTEGEPVIGGLKGATRHFFCPSCMSWLYTLPEGLDGFVNVRSSMLEDAKAHRPFVDVFVGEGMGWAASGAERRYDTVPEETEFPQLMADYAQWDGRVMQ